MQHKFFTTYMPSLLEALEKTSGDIVEVGVGCYSTPFLHWYCYKNNRNLVSYETDNQYYEEFKEFEDTFHKIVKLTYYEEIPDQKADVVFIDSFPVGEREELAKKFTAKHILIHDII